MALEAQSIPPLPLWGDDGDLAVEAPIDSTPPCPLYDEESMEPEDEEVKEQEEGEGVFEEEDYVLSAQESKTIQKKVIADILKRKRQLTPTYYCQKKLGSPANPAKRTRFVVTPEQRLEIKKILRKKSPHERQLIFLSKEKTLGWSGGTVKKIWYAKEAPEGVVKKRVGNHQKLSVEKMTALVAEVTKSHEEGLPWTTQAIRERLIELSNEECAARGELPPGSRTIDNYMALLKEMGLRDVTPKSKKKPKEPPKPKRKYTKDPNKPRRNNKRQTIGKRNTAEREADVVRELEAARELIATAREMEIESVREGDLDTERGEGMAP